MILLLKLTLLGVLLALIYGWLFERVLAAIFRLEWDHNLHFSITLLLGVALLAALLGVWSLFAKVDSYTLRLFWALGLYLSLVCIRYILIRLKVIQMQVRSLGILSWSVFFMLLIYALYLASASDVTYDTGLYHAQSIRWIESYPATPGIANIHDRLGFNSNLFLLSAFWGLADKGEHAYQVPGLIIFAAFALFCLYLIVKSPGKFKLSAVVAAGILIYLLFEKGIIVWFASPTADLSAAFLAWCIFLLAAEKIEENTSSEFDFYSVAIVILSLFSVTIKLSIAPVILVAVYFVWQSAGKLNLPKFAILAIVALVVALPWVVRNIFISGYLVYPFYQLDLLDVDWKVPHETAIHTSQVVTAWGRIPYENYSAVISLRPQEWIPRWYRSLPPADHFLVTSIAMTFSLLGLSAWFNGQIQSALKLYAPIYLLLFVGCVYWFVQSPSPRFGYGFLVCLFLFLISPLIDLLLRVNRVTEDRLSLLVQIFLFGYIAYSMMGFSAKSWNRYLHVYKPYPTIGTLSVKVGNMFLLIPNVDQELYPNNDAQCWYDAFPCAPSIPEGLSMRGEKIEDGFYIKENRK
jgi:hypothetical protein